MEQPETTPVMSEEALTWAGRGLWAVCIGVYLFVFVGGLLARGDELEIMGRAMGLTLVTAVLGKVGLALAERATQPVEPIEEGQLDEPDGPIGSLDEEAPSTNVAEQEEDWAIAA